MIKQQNIEKQLKISEIGLTAAEAQGFLTGILVNGKSHLKWKSLFREFMNDGQALPKPLMHLLSQEAQAIETQLQNPTLQFDFLLRRDHLWHEIDDLIAWVNHFLLGLGLLQPHLDQMQGDLKEALVDLKSITRLTYEETENQEELAHSFEEIKEYVKVIVFMCADHFYQEEAPKVH